MIRSTKIGTGGGGRREEQGQEDGRWSRGPDTHLFAPRAFCVLFCGRLPSVKEAAAVTDLYLLLLLRVPMKWAGVR